MRRLGAIAVCLGLLVAACTSAEVTTTTASSTTTTVAITTTTTEPPPTTTTTEPPTTTTTEALAGAADFAEIVLAGWEQRRADGEPNEELFHLIYDFLVRDSNFAEEALEPEEALEAGEVYCLAHEGFIDTFGIVNSATNTMQSIGMMQAIYTRVRESHALTIAIAAAGGLCSRDVMRSTADSFEQAAAASG